MIIIMSKKQVLKKAALLFFGSFLVFMIIRGLHRRTVAVSSIIEQPQKGYIAIVIDDFGYDGEGTEEMLSLDIPLTAAIMPFSSNSAENCEKVHQAGKEIIVHMPMESLTGKKSWVGDKAVFTDMSDEDIHKTVEEALDIVKYAVGINNHMGSAIMENERCLNAVIDIVAQRGLLFVDSVTSGKTQGSKVCDTKNVPLIKRDVFLDSTDDISVVKKQLNKAGEIALKKGYALAIGHVGPEGGKITAQAIKELAPELQKKGIEFVTVSELSKVIETGQIQTKKTSE